VLVHRNLLEVFSRFFHELMGLSLEFSCFFPVQISFIFLKGLILALHDFLFSLSLQSCSSICMLISPTPRNKVGIS